MSYAILTKAFWADTLERTVATAAQAVAATWGADLAFPNAFTLDYKVLAGVAVGGALAALVKQLAKLGLTAQVPDAPVVAAKRSGGDIEIAPVAVAMVTAPADPLTPVTDETVFND